MTDPYVDMEKAFLRERKDCPKGGKHRYEKVRSEVMTFYQCTKCGRMRDYP